MHSDYAYAIELFRADGTAIAQSRVTPEWGPAIEWIYLEGMRSAQLPPIWPANPLTAPGRIEPIWHARLGPPYASGFRLTVTSTSAREMSRDIPTGYLRRLTTRISATLVADGRLASGEAYLYLIHALPASAPPAAGVDPPAFAIEEIAHRPPLVESSLQEFLCHAAPTDGHAGGADLPVFLPPQVLDEAVELSRRAGAVETGGVLVGHLHRDASIPELFVEVSAQIPAAHTHARSTKLTFTPETWGAVRAALARRGRHESMLGWWHFHPSPCVMNDCPPQRRTQCTASSAFFSSDDVALHTALFSRAYCVGLLISAGPGSAPTASLYGWQQGLVRRRGFYIQLEAAPPSKAVSRLTSADAITDPGSPSPRSGPA